MTTTPKFPPPPLQGSEHDLERQDSGISGSPASTPEPDSEPVLRHADRDDAEAGPAVGSRADAAGEAVTPFDSRTGLLGENSEHRASGQGAADAPPEPHGDDLTNGHAPEDPKRGGISEEPPRKLSAENGTKSAKSSRGRREMSKKSR